MNAEIKKYKNAILTSQQEWDEAMQEAYDRGWEAAIVCNDQLRRMQESYKPRYCEHSGYRIKHPFDPEPYLREKLGK